MKNHIFTLILIFSFSFTFSQVTNEGEPKSWALNYNYTLQNPNLIPLSNTAPPLTIHGAEYVVELISFSSLCLE